MQSGLVLWKKLEWLVKLKPLLFIGKISYALYLVHQVVGYIIIRYFEINFKAKTIGILIAFLLSILIAYSITFIFEPILRKWLFKLNFFKLKPLNQ